MAGDNQDRERSNSNIANTLITTLAPLVLNSVMMIFYLVIMLRYNVLLTLVGVLSILINIYVSNFISKKRVNITRVSMRDTAKIIEDAESSYGTELLDDTLGLIAAAGEKTLTDEEINALLNNTPGV